MSNQQQSGLLLIWNVRGKEPFKPARYLNVTVQFLASALLACPLLWLINVNRFQHILPVIQSYVYILEWWWWSCSIAVCDDCNQEWEGDCPVHGPLTVVEDTKVNKSPLLCFVVYKMEWFYGLNRTDMSVFSTTM